MDVGNCRDFSPAKESLKRNAEGLIHALETKEIIYYVTSSSKGASGDDFQTMPTRQLNGRADRLRAAGKIRLGSRKRFDLEDLVCVKAYSRPAAGARAAKQDELRPVNVLLDCCRHLFCNVLDNAMFPFLEKVEFIADRLRSMKQDVVIQRLSGPDVHRLLEWTVKFLALARYELVDNTSRGFDPALLEKQLTDALCLLLDLYFDDGALTEKIRNGSCDAESAARTSEMLAFHLLRSCEDSRVAVRLLQRCPYTWRTDCIRISFKLLSAFSSGNYVRVVRLSSALPLLPKLAVALYVLPLVQRNGLQALCKAVGPRGAKVKLASLRATLFPGPDAGILASCSHYGLETDEKAAEINLLKANLKVGASLHRACRMDSIEEELSTMMFGHWIVKDLL